MSQESDRTERLNAGLELRGLLPEGLQNAIAFTLSQGAAEVAEVLEPASVQRVDTDGLERAFYNRVSAGVRTRARGTANPMFGFATGGSVVAEIESRFPINPVTGIQDQTVMLVDDGFSSDLVLRAAINALRKGEPRRLALVVPVLPRGTANILSSEVDDLVTLAVVTDFDRERLHIDGTQANERADTARDLMHEAKTVRPETSVYELTSMLVSDGLEGVCVTDGNGHLVGVVTAMDVIFQDRHLDRLKWRDVRKVTGEHVSDIMTEDAHSVGPEANLTDIANQMWAGGFTILPVVENERVVGVVDKQSLLRSALLE